MPTLQHDPDACRRRNFATAIKGRNAVPVRFNMKPPESGPGVTSSRGTLPADEDAALAAINAKLGRSGDDSLRADQVYLLYPEVGNTNYISDRFAFMGRSTLRNVAAMAADGFAFMNSHRTGDLSTPAELPFGRTFCGRFEMGKDGDGNPMARAVVGAYMLRGKHPNGANGPSTDDLFAGIEGGTIFDVSLGLYGGDCMCDVCGESLNAYDSETGRYCCPHVPGTHYEMEEPEIADQRARGVPEGFCTYTIEDANPGEFSAVFDGAVPGAGFRKAVTLARKGKLSGAALSQARHAYRNLLIPGDGRAGRLSQSRPKGQPMPFSLADVFRKIKVSPEDAADLGLDIDDEIPPARLKGVAGTLAPAQPPVDLSPELAKLQKALDDERSERASEKLAREQERETDRLAKQADKIAGIKSAASAFAVKAVTDLKVMPPGKTALAGLHAYLHLSVAGLPTDDLAEGSQVFSATDALASVMANLAPHSLTGEKLAARPGAKLPEGVDSMSHDGTIGPRGENLSDERVASLLSHTPTGQAALAAGLAK